MRFSQMVGQGLYKPWILRSNLCPGSVKICRGLTDCGPGLDIVWIYPVFFFCWTGAGRSLDIGLTVIGFLSSPCPTKHRIRVPKNKLLLLKNCSHKFTISNKNNRYQSSTKVQKLHSRKCRKRRPNLSTLKTRKPRPRVAMASPGTREAPKKRRRTGRTMSMRTTPNLIADSATSPPNPKRS